MYLFRKNPGSRRRQRGVALIVVLSLVVIVSLILVAFVTAMRLERTASFSYSQSIAADQVARGALNLIIGDLQNEMAKDAAPDLTYPSRPLYTNVSSSNIGIQYIGTNAAMPNLVRISTTTNYTGTAASSSLLATAINSSAPSLNGRYVDTNRWNMPMLGQFPVGTTPNWIVLTRNGATNASSLTFGQTGNTLNNPVTGNPNYGVGRFAYAIYDEGGLIDVTSAGYPSSLTASQIQQIKGSMAGVLVAQTNFNVDQDGLINWRNPVSKNSYLDYVTNYQATNGTGKVYPGDNGFLSRQDLIKAAKDGIAGLSTNALSNLTTFSRDKNAPSWGPTYNAADFGGSSAYAYKNSALTAASTNRLIPSARYTGSGTITDYLSDGTAYTYSVNAGDSVVQRRFPLDRLNWITANGPLAGISAKAIQDCFGLVWGRPDDSSIEGNVWKYVGPTGAVEITSIATLNQVASGLRMPNFFELIQAGILGGSIAVTDRTDNAGSALGPFPSTHQASAMFQVLKIGASMIDQYDADSYPTPIECTPAGGAAGERYLAVGSENLPGVTMFTTLMGAPPPARTLASPASANAVESAAVYLMLGLWNPNRVTSNSSTTVPTVRVHIKGGLAAYMYFGAPPMEASYVGGDGLPNSGYDVVLDDTIELSTGGVSGFKTASVLTAGDVNVASSSHYSATPTAAAPSAADGGRWETTYSMGGPNVPANMIGYRLPDFSFYLGTSHHDSRDDVAQHWAANIVYGYGAANGVTVGATPFNVYMEYKSPSGWVPYQYAVGNSSPQSWIRGSVVTTVPVLSVAPSGGYGVPTTVPRTYMFPNYVQPLVEAVVPKAVAGLPTGAPQNQDQGMILQVNYNGPIETPQGPGTVRLYQPGWERSSLFLNSDPQSSRLNSVLFYRPHSTGSADLANLNSIGMSAGSAPVLWSSASDTMFAQGLGGLTAGTAAEDSSGVNRVKFTPGSKNDNTTYYQYSKFSASFFPAQLSRNNSASDFTTTQGTNYNTATAGLAYQDRDGLLRISDFGIYTTPSITAGNPYANTPNRKMILDRPFKTPGELGYVFRDAPWKTLDFFSRKSADAGLLDLFTTVDTTNKWVSGRINLNAKNTTAFNALIDGTVADLVSGVTTSVGAPSTIASSLVAFTGTSPLINKSQLADSFGPSLPNTAFPGTEESNMKIRREGFVRALSEVGQTRTWNLLVDVIAQAGKFSPGATKLDQFTVEGEKRFWLHVAIDRYTGEIIDQKLEVVTE